MNPLNREFHRLLASSGWSQARTANELRVDAGTVSRYVAGTVTPSETILRLFAELLGERVMFDGEVVPPSRVGGARYVEDYEVRLLDSLRTIPATPRRMLCDAMHTLMRAHSKMASASGDEPDDSGSAVGPPDPLQEAKRQIIAKGIAHVRAHEPQASPGDAASEEAQEVRSRPRRTGQSRAR